MLISLVRRLRKVRGHDDGVALITVLLLLTVIVAITSMVAMVTVNNVQNAGRDQQAGQALGFSEGGVAQAVTYIRENGVSGVNACYTGSNPGPFTFNAACTLDWANPNNPHLVTVPDASHKFLVYIKPQNKFVLGSTQSGKYEIHATGYAGAGPGYRNVVATVQITAPSFPIGVFSTSVDSGGTANVYHESMLSTGCIDNRGHLTFAGVDPVYGIPAAAHSSKEILDGNTNGSCSPKFPIHSSGACNSSYPGDQDADGGNLTSTGCASYQTSYPSYYSNGSKILSDSDLFSKFSLSSTSNSTTLDQATRDQLMLLAKAQGNYYYNTTTFTVPTQNFAVMYFDLRTNPGGTVDVNPLATTYTRTYNDSASGGMGLSASDPSCTSKSVVVVVDGGNIKLNSSSILVASLFALMESGQGGDVTKANGTSDLIGTVFADGQIDFTGTGGFHMDQCFAQNLPPSFDNVSMVGYHEVDR